MKQVTLLKSEERAEETAPAAINDMHTDTKSSVGGLPEAKGLTIINQGQMTLHYHSYHEASSLAQQSATVPRKRALERSEDEEYSEALASLMDFNLSATNNPTSLVTPKRLRLEGPEPQEHQEKLKEAEDQPGQIQISKKHKLCKNCGKFFYPSQNNGSKTPCNYHPGKWKYNCESFLPWTIKRLCHGELNINSEFMARNFQPLPQWCEETKKERRNSRTTT